MIFILHSDTCTSCLHFLHPIIMLKMCSTTSHSHSVYAYSRAHNYIATPSQLLHPCIWVLAIACVHAFIVTMLEYLHHTEHHCCIILPIGLVTYATLGLIQHTYNRCKVTYHLLSHYHLHQSCLWPYFIQVLKSSTSAAVFCTGS